MDCKSFRNEVLRLENPARLGGAPKKHAAVCHGCRAMHKKLLALEKNLVRVPVAGPRPGAKEKFLRDLEIAPLPGTETTAAPVLAPRPRSRRGWFTGIAASFALVGGAWAISGSNHAKAGLPADPLLNIVVQCNVTLAEDSTATAEDKLKQLSKLALQLAEQMNAISRVDAKGDSLRSLAALYDKVVQAGMVEQSKDLDLAQRQSTLRVVLADLVATGLDADVKAGAVPPAAVEPFKNLAGAAKRGAERIRTILAERS